MKLIALILGLIIERAATHLLHLRELRWFDAYFDYGEAQARKLPAGFGLLGSLVVLFIPVLPVVVISVAFRDVLWDLPYLLFAVIVLLFSLGPRDLGEEVDEFCRASTTGDDATVQRVGKVLMEIDGDDEPIPRAIGEAIFVQANNRIFGVVFWFVVFGPLGAWLFRVSDLYRRRSAFESSRSGNENDHVELIHGVLSFIPARLAALGYAVGGSFDDAFDAWREYRRDDDEPFPKTTDRISAAVGCGAMEVGGNVPATNEAAAGGAMRLVTRALFFWITVVALMTLFGWAV
jgi:AmpE protein